MRPGVDHGMGHRGPRRGTTQWNKLRETEGEERSPYFLLGSAARISSVTDCSIRLISGWYFTGRFCRQAISSAQASGCTSPPKRMLSLLQERARHRAIRVSRLMLVSPDSMLAMNRGDRADRPLSCSLV